MASSSGVSIPIRAVRTTTANQPPVRRLAEDAIQTFLAGTPVKVYTTTGGVIAWPGDGGSAVTDAIAGFSQEDASYLTTLGVPKTLSFGTVPNQPAAVNIPRGAPLNDGKVGVELASEEVVFHGQVGTTAVATDIGKSYGLTIDTDLHWYVDKAKGTYVAVRIVGIDPNDSRGVYFVVLPASRQMLA